MNNCLSLLVQHIGEENEDFIIAQATTHKYPAVFRWAGPGTEVAISGSFDNWRSKIPLSKRYCHRNYLSEIFFTAYSNLHCASHERVDEW